MSFRLSSLSFCRASIVGFVCLAFAGASRGGEGAKNIEVVPFHGTTMDTNFDQPSSSESPMFKAWSPLAPRSIDTQPRQKSVMPPPRTQSNAEIEREKELLDRRRNWVFMTPEDYASDGKKDVEAGETDKLLGKKSGTAMERYYQRLYDADQAAATNQMGKADSDRMGGRTNLFGVQPRNTDDRIFGDSPFSSSSPASDLVQAVKRSDFGGIFGSDTRNTLPTPESIRAEAEQKAHMESFKQLWNIDQPAPAPVVVASPAAAASVDSGPLFGLSSPGMPSVNASFDSPRGSSSSQPAMPEPTINSVRANSRPPHADFSGVPQKPF